jgi:hypothetical protein
LVEKIANPWSVTPEQVGALLRDGTLDDWGMEQQNAAAYLRIAPNTVSRWWQGKGIKDKQFSHLFGLLVESPFFLKRLLETLGIEAPWEPMQGDLARRVALVKAAYRSDNKVVRMALETLEAALEAVGEEPVRSPPGASQATGP